MKTVRDRIASMTTLAVLAPALVIALASCASKGPQSMEPYRANAPLPSATAAPQSCCQAASFPSADCGAKACG